jgi:hypothetical protein
VTDPPRIYLHIGVPKTGTSALQEAGDVFREQLAREGICYPRTPGLRNHVLLAVYASDDARNSTVLPRIVSRLAGRGALDESSPADLSTGTTSRERPRDVVDGFDDEAYSSFRESFPELLKTEIVESGCQKVVLSNEQLSWQLKPPEVQRLADLLRSISSDIRVVVYLRRQDELALSLHSMAIKQGYMHPNLKLGERNPKYNYALLLKSWARVFGKEALIVKVYEKARLKSNDILDDFASVIGYTRGESVQFPFRRSGRRLDAVTLKFLREFNRHVPTFIDSSWNPLRDHVGDTLEAISSESNPVGWSGDPLDEVVRRFAESNAQVAREYLNIEDGKLFSDSPVADHEAKPKLSAMKAIEIAAHLWVSKQKEVIRLQELLAMTEEQVIRLQERLAEKSSLLRKELLAKALVERSDSAESEQAERRFRRTDDRVAFGPSEETTP